MICDQQRIWATQRGIKFDDEGYTRNLNDNLFLPLGTEVEMEFRKGKGDELGADSKKAKLQALHSSSALVVNVFGYWRTRNIVSLAKACAIYKGMTELKFEQTHPTPLGGIPPHLDVKFHGVGLKPVAIECKFTETYRLHLKRMMKPSYYTSESLWSELPACHKLVGRIHKEEIGRSSFNYLDVPQLLKHILGLTTEFGATGFELIYLWYEVPSQEAKRHRYELDKFKKAICDDIRFRDITYQELFGNLMRCNDASQSYLSYIGELYFPGLAWHQS